MPARQGRTINVVAGDVTISVVYNDRRVQHRALELSRIARCASSEAVLVHRDGYERRQNE